jgi:hypothetical protein
MTAYIKRKSNNAVLHSCSSQSTQNDLPYLQELVTEFGYEQNDCIIGDADDSEIQSWIAERTAEIVESAKTYSDKRREEYDALNQFELIGEDSINGTTNHKDAVLAIKAKHPKPS